MAAELTCPTAFAKLYPEIEPDDQWLLDVGDGNQVYWETCGNPAGKPAVVMRGGPGSGCSPDFRRFFNPDVYRIVLFDQRNCGRSLPHASEPTTHLDSNTTELLIRDVELLRQRLGVERWLVLGGSWGCTLSLAYAERHPERVTEMVLFGVTTGRHSELNWLFRGGVAVFFPEQWDRLVAAIPPAYRSDDVVDAYARWLGDADPRVRKRGADEWCLWESATPRWPPATGLAERFKDPLNALAFSRIVTHYVRHNLWLEEGELLEHVGAISNIPGVLINGRFDFQSPIGNAWALSRVWRKSELVIVDQAGHGTDEKVSQELVQATDRFAN